MRYEKGRNAPLIRAERGEALDVNQLKRAVKIVELTNSDNYEG